MDNPESLSRHQASLRWNYQKNSILDVLKLSTCSLYQDVTLLCLDGRLKLNSFLLAAVFPIFRNVLVQVSQYEEEVIISLPCVVGEKIKKFLSDLLKEEMQIVFGEDIGFLFLNQQDVRINTMKDNERKGKDKLENEGEQSIELHSQEIEDAELDFTELDPLDDDSCSEDIKLEANQVDTKVETINNMDPKGPFKNLRSIENLDERINQFFSKKSDGRYGCLHCPYLSSKLYNMKVHVEKHINGLKELLKCIVCNRAYSTVRAFRAHEKEFHSKKKNVLGEDMEDNDEDEFIVENGLQCNFGDCFYRTTKPNLLKKHLNRHKNGLKPKQNKEMKCIFEGCEFLAPSIWSVSLSRHLKSQHSNARPVCQQCGKSFPSYEKLLTHMSFELNRTPCELCGKIFSGSNLKKHIKHKHSSEKSIECDKCKQSFRPYTFSKHKCFREKEPPKEICIICGKRVLNLNAHINRIHEFYKDQCRVCGKILQKDCIKSHMKTHEEKKTCQLCGKMVRSIEKHMKYSHTADEDRKFQCQDCGKGFDEDYTLQKHRINVHLKTYPYHCRYGCDAKYNDTSNRNSHEKKKHGGVFIEKK